MIERVRVWERVRGREGVRDSGERGELERDRE